MAKGNTEPRRFELNLGLTEVEGRTIEAARLWEHAQTDPRLRAELQLLDVVMDGLAEARHGDEGLIDFGCNFGLSAKEVLAVAVLARNVKRRVKAERKATKAEKRRAKEGKRDNG